MKLKNRENVHYYLKVVLGSSIVGKEHSMTIINEEELRRELNGPKGFFQVKYFALDEVEQ